MTGSLKSWAPSSKTLKQKHLQRNIDKNISRKLKSTCIARCAKHLLIKNLLLSLQSSRSSQMKSFLSLIGGMNRICLHQSWILIFHKALTTLWISAQRLLGLMIPFGTAIRPTVPSAKTPRIISLRILCGSHAKRRKDIFCINLASKICRWSILKRIRKGEF